MKLSMILFVFALPILGADHLTLAPFDHTLSDETKATRNGMLERVCVIGWQESIEHSALVTIHAQMHSKTPNSHVRAVAQNIYDDITKQQEIRSLLSRLYDARAFAIEESENESEELQRAVHHALKTLRQQHIPALGEANKKTGIRGWLLKHQHTKLTPEQIIYYQAWHHVLYLFKQNQRLFENNARIAAYPFVIGRDRIDSTVSQHVQLLDQEITGAANDNEYRFPVAMLFRENIGRTPNDHLDDATIKEHAQRYYETICGESKVRRKFLKARQEPSKKAWDKFCKTWAASMQALQRKEQPNWRRGKDVLDFLNNNQELQLDDRDSKQCRALLIVSDACVGQLLKMLFQELPALYKPWTRSIVLEEAEQHIIPKS